MPTREGPTAADRAVGLGLELVGIVRDEGRPRIERWLRARSRLELEQLAVALAAMVPPDESPAKLLAWTEWGGRGV